MRKKIESKKELGDWGEQKAVQYLRLHGYWIKERNWRVGKAEIDIIASTLQDLVFVEVKTRSYRREELLTAPPPGTAVDAAKQRLTRQAAGQYLYRYPTKKQPRMDVIEIWIIKDDTDNKLRPEKIHHIKAAY